MSGAPDRKFWDSIRFWLAAVGIPVVLAVAGFWQFYLKEIWWLASAINLTTEVAVHEAGFGAAAVAKAGNLEAIELVITARNPSSSTIYLRNNYWAAWGITIGPRRQAGEQSEDWLSDATERINNKGVAAAGKYYQFEGVALVSAGPVFSDTALHANEKISATFVFYVLQHLYDLVFVNVSLPTTSRENPAQRGTSDLTFRYRPKSDRSQFEVTSVTNGRHEEVARNKAGDLFPSDISYYGYQRAELSVELSLWRSAPSPLTPTQPAKASSP